MKSNQKAITLLALVITIIVLVILVTVSITLLNGSGILHQAKTAKQIAENDQIKTDIALNKIYNQIVNGTDILPENTPNTEGGTSVKPNENWEKAGVYTVSDQTGEILETAPFSSKTVYAIADGKGNTIPVPFGFYYVGGTKDTGVVISDNQEDQNKYAGKEDVPSGIELNEDGSLHYTLKGNQFVWIPCTLEDYQKHIWSSFQFNTPEPGTPIGEKSQIKKYGGFYVGRYEAGLAESIPEYTQTQLHTAYNQVYNIKGVPQSKAGIVPWHYIDWKMAKNNSEKMYQTSNVQSGLITGTQWDVMITWLAGSTDSTALATSCNWGNYCNVELQYTGRIAKHTLTNNAWYSDSFPTTNQTGIKPLTISKNYCYLLTTGASEQAKNKNLYDVAGNLWEMTEETSILSTTSSLIARGGRAHVDFALEPVCSRTGLLIDYTLLDVGFRVALYLQ